MDYQHLGNLAPAELDTQPLLAQVRASTDGGKLLREFARNPKGTRFTIIAGGRGGELLTPGAIRARQRRSLAALDFAVTGVS